MSPAGALVLNVAAITGDDTVGIAEKAAGFAVAGDTGVEEDVAVTVKIGTTTLAATSARTRTAPMRTTPRRGRSTCRRTPTTSPARA